MPLMVRPLPKHIAHDRHRLGFACFGVLACLTAVVRLRGAGLGLGGVCHGGQPCRGNYQLQNRTPWCLAIFAQWHQQQQQERQRQQQQQRQQQRQPRQLQQRRPPFARATSGGCGGGDKATPTTATPFCRSEQVTRTHRFAGPHGRWCGNGGLLTARRRPRRD